MIEHRLDKWLWCARLFKTRSIAADAIKNGRVTINGIRAKPARTVQIGDAIVVEKPPYSFHLEVLGSAKQRVSAALAAALYRESEESIAARADLSVRLKASRVIDDTRFGKLNKKERRDRERFKRNL